MKRTAIVNLSKIRILNEIRQNGVILTLTVLFVLGILSGAILCVYSDFILKISDNSLSNYLTLRTSSGFLRILVYSFLSSLLYCGIVFISGTSVVGTILVPATVFFKGFFYGAMCGNMYLHYLLKGIAFNALILIPSCIIYVFSLIIFSREAMYFSLSLAKLFTPKGVSISIYNEFKRYFIRFIIFLVMVVFSSAIDALMSLWLINFFNF